MTRQRNSMKALAVCMTALVSTCCIAAQAAEPNESERLSMTVKYADLNLASSQGAEMLYRRIRRAAEQVCFPGQEDNLARIASRKECIGKAVGEAVASVGSPTLTAVYEANQGRVRRAAVAPAAENSPVG